MVCGLRQREGINFYYDDNKNIICFDVIKFQPNVSSVEKIHLPGTLLQVLLHVVIHIQEMLNGFLMFSLLSPAGGKV